MRMQFKTWLEGDDLQRDLFGNIIWPDVKRGKRKKMSPRPLPPAPSLATPPKKDPNQILPDEHELRLQDEEPSIPTSLVKPSMTRKIKWQKKEPTQNFDPYGPLSDRLAWAQDMERIHDKPLMDHAIQILYAAGHYPPGIDLAKYTREVRKLLDGEHHDEHLLAFVTKKARAMLSGEGPERYTDTVIQQLLNRFIVDKTAALDLNEARTLFQLLNKEYELGHQGFITDEIIQRMLDRLGDPVR